MADEYRYLIFSLILFYAMIGWQVLQGMRANGVVSAFGARDGWVDGKHVGHGRATRAVRNMTEALVLFAPLVIIAVETGQTSVATAAGAALFFVSRLLYAPTYWFGVPYLRTLFWFGGVIGLILILVEVLL